MTGKPSRFEAKYSRKTSVTIQVGYLATKINNKIKIGGPRSRKRQYAGG
jgi:hypothetical protein